MSSKHDQYTARSDDVKYDAPLPTSSILRAVLLHQRALVLKVLRTAVSFKQLHIHRPRSPKAHSSPTLPFSPTRSRVPLPTTSRANAHHCTREGTYPRLVAHLPVATAFGRPDISRLLEDCDLAGWLSTPAAIGANVMPFAAGIGFLPAISISKAIIGRMKSAHAEKVARLVEVWDLAFFGPRRLRAVIAYVGMDVKGAGSSAAEGFDSDGDSGRPRRAGTASGRRDFRFDRQEMRAKRKAERPRQRAAKRTVKSARLYLVIQNA